VSWEPSLDDGWICVKLHDSLVVDWRIALASAFADDHENRARIETAFDLWTQLNLHLVRTSTRVFLDPANERVAFESAAGTWVIELISGMLRRGAPKHAEFAERMRARRAGS
jgi:hypothetical protein